MKIGDIINGQDTKNLLRSILTDIHLKGPVKIQDFEHLAYIKKFQPITFREYEKTALNLMGLFYKTTQSDGLLQEVYSIFADSIENDIGVKFTPVQADAYKKIRDNIYFSFSAPTSAGKSYLFRRIISESTGDIIIVVPSRALIAEYVHILNNLVDKDVLVLQFIEIVNILKTKRRVFVITPERGVELFKNISRLNIKLFLFDEAQISEEPIRGMRFDSFVRRVDKVLPYTKKVFTHPFILNPEAQLSKHRFELNSDSYCYKQNSVGKIYLAQVGHVFKYFSPFDAVSAENYIDTDEDIVAERLKQSGTILIYTSKNKIYDGSFMLDFADYVELCTKVTHPKALAYIEELRTFIGASTRGIEKHSNLIDMMEKGIVIHHGSIPLKARLIIEAFVNESFAKICFSTSTLIQGINMPFDIVWISNFKFSGSDAQKNLDLKNLIGRAGRSTQEKDSFDFGYVIVEKRNVKTFKSRIQEQSVIKSTSLLDENINSITLDMLDTVEAIKNDSFNDKLQLTERQVARISEADIDDSILIILNNLIIDNYAIKAADYYRIPKATRDKIKSAFHTIYIAHLRRKELSLAEKKILSAAIPMLLWQIQGKSFAEIVSLRHAFITHKDEQRSIIARVKKGELTPTEGASLRQALTIKFTPMAAPIPDITVKAPGLFGLKTSVLDFDYDKLVYDTYDYLDKVIGLSLTDPLSASFKLFYEKTQDDRGLVMANYIKYGTNDVTEIWLLKYGFSFDDVEWIKYHIHSIDENEIKFKESFSLLTEAELNVIKRYI